MAGNIINQRNTTVFSKVQDATVSARIIQPVPYIPSSSYLAPVAQPTYADVVFRASLNPVPAPAPAASNYVVLTYGKTPGPSGNPVAAPAGISYFDIEDESTYFEEVNGSTYYVVE